MALSFVEAKDITIKFIDRGAADGSGTGTPASVVALCNNFMHRRFVGEKIRGGGFGATKKFRPGSLEEEADLDIDVSYSGGPVAAVAGNMAQIAWTMPGQSEVVSSDLIIMSNDISGVQDGKGNQKIRLEGPADV